MIRRAGITSAEPSRIIHRITACLDTTVPLGNIKSSGIYGLWEDPNVDIGLVNSSPMI
jgi:hypothetical protein